MFLFSKLTILLALSYVCAICPLTSRAQSFSPTEEREIRNFKLTDDYLNRYKAVLDEDRKTPTQASERAMVRATGPADSSLNQLVRELAQDPREHTSLEKCGLSQRGCVGSYSACSGWSPGRT